MTGTTLGSYQIESELGRGGMGIVYKAHDTKLERTVALKVLPAAALASEDDRARFYREAKAAAALNHPNIAQIYQIDEAVPEGSPGDDVRPYIAMEFIEGGTLEDRIKSGPLKLDEAVRIATQVAEALKAAHAKQIVHRDIKSANIMLTSDGQAKVLDFGLAQTSHSTKLTRMGSTLGTVAYMSPEQARGEEVDGRTDLYSLGTVLYEMIAGRLPFGGEYEQAVVYSILNADPEPLTALRTGVPMELERITNKLLAKDAARRYQTGADLIADLGALDAVGLGASGAATTVIRPAVGPPSGSPATRQPWLVMAAVLIVGVVAGGLLWPRPDVVTPLNIGLQLPELDATITSDAAPASNLLALSPDGYKVAYIGSAPNDGLYVLDMTSGEPARFIAEGAETPTFSPDSRFVAYAWGENLYRAGLLGGSPELLNDGLTDIVGLHWATDGYLYYAPDYAMGIVRISQSGGEPELVTAPDTTRGEIGHVSPYLHPDERHLIYTAYSTSGYELKVLDLETGSDRVMGPGVTARVLASNVAVFAQGPELVAARIDPANARIGPPRVLSDKLYHSLASFASNIGTSDRGDVIFIEGLSHWGSQLEIRDWDGTIEPLRVDVNQVADFVLSKDGKQVLVVSQDALKDPDLFIYNVESRDTRQITRHPLYDDAPVFSRDEQSVFFTSERNGIADIYEVDLTSGEVETVYTDSRTKYLSTLSHDGRYLFFHFATGLYVLDLQSDGETDVVVTEHLEERASAAHPTGNWVAYQSTEFGTPEVFVVDYPTTRPRQRITIGGGQYPQWSPDGRWLYFKRGTSLFRVAMSPDAIRIGEPEFVLDGVYGKFQMLPDGSGILARNKPDFRQTRLIQRAIPAIEDELTLE